jgi:hypothetical protein
MIKIVKSLAIILGVVAIAGGGTYAWQQQTETISGITYSAGSQDLKIDNDASSSTANWVDSFDAGPGFDKTVKPGSSGEQVIDIKNVSDAAGKASVRLDLRFNKENGVLTPEIAANDNATDDDWSGELAQNMRVKISYKKGTDLDSTWVEKYDYTLAQYYENKSMLELGSIDFGTAADADVNGIGNVKLEWYVPSDASNMIMTDQVGINVIFGLE